MLKLFTQGQTSLISMVSMVNVLGEALWIDLDCPTKEEETAVEAVLGIDVPTREEMQEIELSNRLYSEVGATFMIANILSHTDADDVVISPITLILHNKRLITVRYASPRTVEGFIVRCSRGGHWDADLLAIGLIGANIERSADIIERVSMELDRLSTSIFLPDQSDRSPEVSSAVGEDKNKSNRAAKGRTKKRRSEPRNFQTVLEETGRLGELVAKIRDSLVSLQRLLTHYIGTVSTERGDEQHVVTRLKNVARDVEALREHASFMTSKVNFLLDATVGMINIEQNAIIKIFSVAAVIFLPPTLIASIYGMNFEFMPELEWRFGYSLTIGLMIVSAILPFWFFKRCDWL